MARSPFALFGSAVELLLLLLLPSVSGMETPSVSMENKTEIPHSSVTHAFAPRSIIIEPKI